MTSGNRISISEPGGLQARGAMSFRPGYTGKRVCLPLRKGDAEVNTG